jgi:hypothetical protein
MWESKKFTVWNVLKLEVREWPGRLHNHVKSKVPDVNHTGLVRLCSQITQINLVISYSVRLFAENFRSQRQIPTNLHR